METKIKLLFEQEDIIKLIDKVLSEFDFDKVHKVMKMLDWKWAFEEEMRVPTIYELIKHTEKNSLRALNAVINGKNENISCGGFEVVAYYEDGELGLAVKFVLTDYDDYISKEE